MLLGVASRAQAQEAYDSSRPVDIFSGTVVAPTAILGQGGAVIGLAEGSAAIAFNPAAVANRYAHSGGDWLDYDWSLDLVILAPDNPRDTDLFNSGRQSLDAGRLTSVLASVSLQLGRLGFGINGKTLSFAECGDASTHCSVDAEAATETAVNSVRLALGYAYLDGDLVVGISVFQPDIQFSVGGDDSSSPNISGTALEFGALYRPAGENYRFGLKLRRQSRAKLQFEQPELGGRLLPSALVLPWQIGVGAAYSFGTRPLNVAPTYGSEGDAKDYDAYARGHSHVAVDVVVHGNDTGAVGLDGWFEQLAVPIDEALSFSFHLGVQSEVVPNRLVLRGGAYLEPARYAGVSIRPHLTGGADLRLFRFIWDWYAGAAIDVSQRFRQLTFTAGFWH